MWNANKLVFSLLLLGSALLIIAYFLLSPSHPLAADRLLYTGFCALLFIGACISYYLAKKGQNDE